MTHTHTHTEKLRVLEYRLGVRQQTCNSLTFLESGIPPMKALIMSKQWKYFKRVRATPAYLNSPLHFAINLAISNQTPMGSYLKKLFDLNEDPLQAAMDNIQNTVNGLNSTRATIYKTVNPSLKPHYLYENTGILESYRIYTTRLRLSSHYLRIETGRWSRIDRSQRKCNCGVIQDEERILCHYHFTCDLRNEVSSLNFYNLSSLFDSRDSIALCEYAHKALHRIYNVHQIHH